MAFIGSTIQVRHEYCCQLPVGTSPTDEKDIKMKKEILSRLNLSEPLSPRNLLSDEPYVCQSYIICKNIVRNVDVLPRRFCWDLLSI